jgi:hypothetical protein
MRRRRQLSKPTPIVNAQNELNAWYLENLAKHTIREDDIIVFSNLDSKELFQIYYQEKIQELIINYGLHSNQLMRSVYDTNEIGVSTNSEPEHVGITIEQIELDCNEPSEETKESEPNPHILRIEEFQNHIREHESKIRQYNSEILEYINHIREHERNIRQYKDMITELEIYYK